MLLPFGMYVLVAVVVEELVVVVTETEDGADVEAAEAHIEPSDCEQHDTGVEQDFGAHVRAADC